MTDSNDKYNETRGKDADLAARVPKIVSVPEVAPVIKINPKQSGAGNPLSQGDAGNQIPHVIPLSEAVRAKEEAQAAEEATKAAGTMGEDSAEAPSAAAAPAGVSSAPSKTEVLLDVLAQGSAGNAADNTGAPADKHLAAANPATAAGISKAGEVEAAANAEPNAAAGASGEAGAAVSDEDTSLENDSSVDGAPSLKQHAPDGSRPSVKDKGRRAKGRKVAGGASSASGEGEPAKRPSVKNKLNSRSQFIVAGVVLGVLLASIILVSWARWWQYSDAQDIQGEWFSIDTTGTAVVTIDAEKINLASDVAYSYELDATAKTITYDFGNMHGQGRYWFSGDRSTLVIVDGEGYTAQSTFFEDVSLWWQNLFAGIQGQGLVIPQGEDVIRLQRSDSSMASEQGDTGAAGSSDAAAAANENVNAGMAAGVEDVAQQSDASVNDAAASGNEQAQGASSGEDEQQPEANADAGDEADRASTGEVEFAEPQSNAEEGSL